MINCPNCGSTAQFKISTPLYYDEGVWKQQKKCECGCIVVLRYEERIDKIEYPQDNQPISKMAYQMIQAIRNKRGE
jgi:hypothetical protein